MYIPQNSTRAAAPISSSSSPGPHDELIEVIDNPITWEIILMLAIVAKCMLMLRIMEYFGWIDSPSSYDNDDDYEEQLSAAQEDVQPLSNQTLATEDDAPPHDDYEADGRRGKYGTYYQDDHGKWFNADGVEMSHSEWIQAVYDPLD